MTETSAAETTSGALTSCTTEAELIASMPECDKRTVIAFFRKLKMKVGAYIVRRLRARNSAATLIQSIARRRLGRRRFVLYKVLRYREKRQDIYKTPDGLYRFYFIQNGAAIILQRWFRKFPYRRKRIWRHKYRKFIEKLKHDNAERKKKRMADMKRKLEEAGHNTKIVITDKHILRSATKITKIVRGFLGRRRVLHLRRRHSCTRRIQALARGYLVRAHRLPHVGTRFRSGLIRTRQWRAHHLSAAAALEAALAAPGDFTREDFKRLPRRRHSISLGNFRVKVVSVGTAATGPLLSDGGWWHLRRMDRAARKIRRAYKTYKINAVFSLLFERRHILYVISIQHWYLCWKRRRQVARSLRLIQPLWLLALFRVRRRARRALRIQTRWRQHRGYLRVRDLRWSRVKGIYSLQGWLLRCLATRRAKARRAEMRRVHEQLAAGQHLFNRSVLLHVIDLTWKGARKMTNVDAPHEVQRLFMTYTQQQTMMDMSRLTKLMKDCKLLDKQLDEKQLEMLFIKSKPPTEKRLTFANFILLCQHVAAIKFLDIDPARIKPLRADEDPFAEKKSEGDDGEEEEEEGGGRRGATAGRYAVSGEDKIQSFRFGRLTGRVALAMRFVFAYLAPTHEYDKVVAGLRAKAASAVAKKLVAAAVTRMQRWTRRRLASKRLERLRHHRLEGRLNVLKAAAATRIQVAMKGFLGRRRITRMAQLLYNKYVDKDSGAPFWYNPRTKNSFWRKPRLLSTRDCGIPILMPSEDEAYDILCCGCANEPANVYCNECDEGQCFSCFRRIHARGARSKHTQLPFTKCVLCDYQAGTRYCVKCDDAFCDTCFSSMHAKGRLRLHIFTWQCDPCPSCERRAVKWVWTDPYDGAATSLCGVCYTEGYGKPQRSAHLKRYKFQGKCVIDYKAEKRSNEEKLAVAEEFARRRAELARSKRGSSATTIQRVWRGRRRRRAISSFLAERRAFMRLREEQMAIRNNPLYLARLFWGVAPVLESDFTREKVLKMYPLFMHSVLAEAFENKWSDACHMYRKEEEYARQARGATAASRLAVGIVLSRAKGDARTAQISLEEARRKHVAAREAFRSLRASAGKSPVGEKKKELERRLKLAEAAAKEEQRAAEKLANKQRSLQKAQGEMDAINPPQGIRQLVRERRACGIEQPFTLSAYKGSKLMLTCWHGADASSPQEGRWQTKLLVGDRILVKGVTFTVISKEQALGIDEAKEDLEDEEEPELEEEEEEHSDAGPEPLGALEDEDAAERRAAQRVIEWTPEHVCLDRPWVLEDAQDLLACKLLPRVLLERPLLRARDSFMAAYPVQKALAVASITAHKVGALNDAFASLFDDDSDYGELVRQRAQRCYRSSEGIVKYSRSVVQMSYDNDFFRGMKRVGYRLGRGLYKLGKKLGSAANKYVKINEDPYFEWQQSKDKVRVAIFIELIVDSPQRIGEFEMCLDAPADVMRAYVRRRLREKLNDICGDAFLFFSLEENKLLPRDMEPKRYSKDFAPFIINKKTMIGCNEVVIKRDPSSAQQIEPIGEYPLEEEAKDDGPGSPNLSPSGSPTTNIRKGL